VKARGKKGLGGGLASAGHSFTEKKKEWKKAFREHAEGKGNLGSTSKKLRDCLKKKGGGNIVRGSGGICFINGTREEPTGKVKKKSERGVGKAPQGKSKYPKERNQTCVEKAILAAGGGN